MRILLVEDNPAEACLTREALGECGVSHELYEVADGEAATSFLYRRDAYRDVPLPDLIFLDLNLPRKNGRQVLFEMKADATLAEIPVIVITNSQAPEDIEQVYRLKANCYLVKPPDIDEFFYVVRKVIDFWFPTAEFREVPPRPNAFQN